MTVKALVPTCLDVSTCNADHMLQLETLSKPSFQGDKTCHATIDGINGRSFP